MGCTPGSVTETLEVEKFYYGHPKSVLLEAIVPVFTCKECDFSWTEMAGEEAREKAVAEYLAITENKDSKKS